MEIVALFLELRIVVVSLNIFVMAIVALFFKLRIVLIIFTMVATRVESLSGPPLEDRMTLVVTIGWVMFEVSCCHVIEASGNLSLDGHIYGHCCIVFEIENCCCYFDHFCDDHVCDCCYCCSNGWVENDGIFGFHY